MDSYYITFRSVTFAQRGEGILRRSGLGCALHRTPRALEERGCGYCLRLRQQDVSKAVELLRQQQIPFQKLYAQRADGKMEEIAL